MPDPTSVLGHCTLRSTNPTEFAHNRPSLFADPIAWQFTAAIGQALQPHRDLVLANRDHVATITMSEHATLHTMRSVATAAQRGRISPLRFAGANPATITGLPCIRWGLRGPSLALSTDPTTATSAALTVAHSWLTRGLARYLVLAGHRIDNAGVHEIRCVVAAHPLNTRDIHPLIVGNGAEDVG
ncbi:beta-ketoacyl synthase N-terminal-like domain-containing protein [Saccharopolyspora sp. 5N708]|uniref:beta-ketoacyl synthase N-terminal-like domain-containing protein n=1 Tax=Saccharopolyspora sp. 5N708 TaxID=3457424 RepID=UPI003FD4C9D0